MRAHVYLSELADALEFVSAGDSFETAAYVSRETGRIFFVAGLDTIEEELPGDVEDGTLYASVPHKHDLDLGQGLAFRFIEANAPEAYDEVRGYFSRRGAYGRFRNLLERRRLLEAWYSYEQAATEAALREWAGDENLDIVDGRRADG